MRQINPLEGMIKFQTDRLLDKQNFEWDNEAVNIMEELLEAKGYDVPKDKRAALKEKFLNFIENIVNDLNLKQKEPSTEDKLDAFCDIAEFAIGAILKLGYDPYCALNEMQKHINSRTGKIINGKFVKDTNIKTYKPNYKECKMDNSKGSKNELFTK